MESNEKLRPLRIPSWTDLAVQLGRMPRFAGRTVPVWTVLHHSLVVEAIGASMVAERPKRIRENLSLYMILHDDHEAFTGDIPTPFKTDSIRQTQAEISRQIRAKYGIPEPPPRYKSLVKEADERSLAAEATLLVPGRGSLFAQPYDWPRPEPQDIEIVHFFLENYGTPHYTMYPDSPAVEAFVRIVEAGVASLK